ncbi:hypothetical protein CapIbe_021537 [Capra ibex]
MQQVELADGNLRNYRLSSAKPSAKPVLLSSESTLLFSALRSWGKLFPTEPCQRVFCRILTVAGPRGRLEVGGEGPSQPRVSAPTEVPAAAFWGPLFRLRVPTPQDGSSEHA